MQRGEVATLNLIVKADVQGSLEAIIDALRKLEREHDEVRLSFVHRGVGGITESDVQLAVASNATIIGFNVRPDRKARDLAEHENVEMRLYEVIYKVIEDVKNAISVCSSPSSKRWSPARPRCARSSAIPRVGEVAGCYVTTARSPAARRSGSCATATIIWKGDDRVAAPVQGGRPRGPDRLRVRYRARELPGPQAGRHHRDLQEREIPRT